MKKHDLGSLVRVTAEFREVETRDLIDPDVVKLSILSPSNVLTTYVYGDGDEVVKDAVGIYYSDVSAEEAGRYYYRWWSTGDGQAATEKYFEVLAANAVE